MGMWPLLQQLSWSQWRHQPGHSLVSVLAIAMGVALSFAVHLINESALNEFSAAVRSINGQADFELRAQAEGFDENIYPRVALHPQVAVASPVIELDVLALNAQGEKLGLRLLGLDALVVPTIAPELLAQVAAGEDRLAMLDPSAVFLNQAAASWLGQTPPSGTPSLRLVSGTQTLAVVVRGRVAAAGPPLAVMDLAGVQTHFNWVGRLSRIDVRLKPGADQATVLRELKLPASLIAVTPAQSAQQVTQVSRAYRVNLTVLAMVAVFTGGFLVFSALSLSVARRLPQLALLGVLGLSAKERSRWILLEALVLGSLGSLLGILLGTLLAHSALQLLAGDLGGGYFPGVAPALLWSPWAALVLAMLGLLAAAMGAMLPARMAQQIQPALALKGASLGSAPSTRRRLIHWIGPGFLLLGLALSFMPTIGGLPLAAYAAVACFLLGGMACVPQGVALMLSGVQPQTQALALLAVERARQQRHVATVAVAGVVASLALSVALTIMVGSFRVSIAQWLNTVLPADLYVRISSSRAGDTAYLSPQFVAQAAALPGVTQVEPQRVMSIQWQADRPPVALIARTVVDPERSLPWVQGPVQKQPPIDQGVADAIPIYVSQAMVSLYGAQAGTRLQLPLPNGQQVPAVVMGVWRDYARQNGAVLIQRSDFERLTQDTRINDLALWLAPETSASAVQNLLRQQAGETNALLEFASAIEIRQLSLRIFDRSFAVTHWLQAVAIGMGLFGLATSVSAQVLARRKEFGLLVHLGLTHKQVQRLIIVETALWTSTGVVVGLLLGAAISAVLVHVVNPQSFHWTMDWVLPWLRLLLLSLSVLGAALLTAWWSGRSAARTAAALAVKEDW
jgi:putative ABC transport system permease protein